MDRRHTCEGFSLVEILVALTVAAVLSLALIAAQRRAFDMAENGIERWRCLDLAMAIMAENPDSQLSAPTGGWSKRVLNPKGEWKLEREYVANAGSWLTLTVKSGRTELPFEWAASTYTPTSR